MSDPDSVLEDEEINEIIHLLIEFFRQRRNSDNEGDNLSGRILFTESRSSDRHRIGPDFNYETFHYCSFRREILLNFEDVPSIEPIMRIAHPNFYFTRQMATNFHMFIQYPENGRVKVKLSEASTKKLWIFGEETQPRNALLIDESKVYYLGEDMYLGPNAPARVDDWMPLNDVNDFASKIIGFVSGDNHTVAYTDTKVSFWGLNNEAQVNPPASETRFRPIFSDGGCESYFKDFILNKDAVDAKDGDKYIKAVCGKNQTLLLTKNGDLYGIVQKFSDPNQPQPCAPAPPTSSHVGLLLGCATSTGKYPDIRTLENKEYVEQNMSNYSVFDIACTPDACFIIIGRRKYRVSKEPGPSKASKEPPKESKLERLGSVFGWGKTDLCPAVDKPTQLDFRANLNKNFVKIAAAKTYVLALNANQDLYFLGPGGPGAPGAGTKRGDLVNSIRLKIPGRVMKDKNKKKTEENGVVNIAAVYSTNTAVVLTTDSQIYVIDGRATFEVRDDLLTSTPFCSMMEAFMRHTEPSRPYQTITFEDEENTGVSGSSGQLPGNKGDKVKRSRENPKGGTTVKRQKSNEETSELKKSSTF